MIFTLAVVVGTFLILISIIDVLTKRIPAFLTTSILFAVAVINFADVNFGILHLSFGILAFIFAYMIYELDFIGGVADIKVIIIIGMMLSSLNYFFVFIILIMVYGFVYKVVWKILIKKAKLKEIKEIPFIPALTFTYFILGFIGGII